jgi:hypothetical protein
MSPINQRALAGAPGPRCTVAVTLFIASFSVVCFFAAPLPFRASASACRHAHHPDARLPNGMHNIVKILCRKKRQSAAAARAGASCRRTAAFPTRYATQQAL